MSLFKFGKKQPVYDAEKASVVIFAKIPEAVRQVLDHPDIDLIIKLEWEYQQDLAQDCPPGEPVAMNRDKLVPNIKQRASFREKDYTEEQINAVLDAEIEYLRMAGIIEE